MFEQNSNTPQPPSNLPFGQPQNPFMPPPPANIPPIANNLPPPAFQPPVNQFAPVPNSAPQTEDMFAATDRPASPASGYAAQPAAFPAYQPGPRISDTDLFGGGGTPWGKIITIIIIVLVAIGGIGAAIWGYNYWISGLKPTAPAAETPVAPAAAAPAITAPAAETPAVIATTTVVAETVVDSDGDGLTDSEETALGTDPQKADTDSDGLTDWAEIKIYKSDPLNPDTDGDTYKDGAEVINGYDPLKPGSARLYEVPQP
ncbi:MAG: hypothetical protein WC517_00200 [Patescibacteria group bacterium]